MKKSLKIFLFIIALITLLTISTIITKNIIENNKNYKGELFGAGPQPQDISIFVLPAIPIISIISPENKTYSTNTILLDYSIINPFDFIWYNLDNKKNITINSPIQFTTTEGSHTLYLYANNSGGSSSKNISFSIETPPPKIEEDGEYGGGDWPINKTQPSENITEQETPKNATKKPKETTQPIRLITIIFLISFIFLILLIFLIIILISERKKKREKEKRKRRKKTRFRKPK